MTRPIVNVPGIIRSFQRFSLVAPGLLALALALGCSKGGPDKSIPSSAFDSAPAELKKSWNDALASWKSHHYAEAAENFVSVQASSAALSQEQSDAVTKAVDEFGQQAFTAANKGDTDATQAVQTLRGASSRRARSAQ